LTPGGLYLINIAARMLAPSECFTDLGKLTILMVVQF
jgi:hypothetical protein